MERVKVQYVDSALYLSKLAEILKNNENIELPRWVDVVKTGHSKELSPLNPDWLYIRMASIARRLYRAPYGMGIRKLAAIYGTPKNRGSLPSHHCKAARGIIRYSLKQLEKIGYVTTFENGNRIITSDGRRVMENIAHACLSSQ